MEWDPRVNEIFARALEIESADELEAFLSRSCDQDAALRASVEELLGSHGKVGSFLETPAVAVDRTIDVDPRALEAGFAATFVSNAAVVIGGAGHSVLKSIGKTITRVPRVTLRDEDTGELARSEETVTETDGRYQLEGEIARGGMGAILKGRDADLGRDLAIKVLLDSHKDNPDVVARFVEEAQIGGQLQHPGIVPVHELGQLSDQRPFFSMKLVKGETLASLLAKRPDGNEDLPKFLGIFEQICQTMAYAHSRGVIHRDLKPANIMVGAFGEVQVMDWGLAKVLGETSVADTLRSEKCDQSAGSSDTVQTRRSRDSDAPDAAQTRMGSVMGTPAYMPPEQALGEVHRLDERADVFGLGAILCEVLTGDPPYVGRDASEVYRYAAQARLEDCVTRLDGCVAEPELIQLAKTALAREPDDRMRDAGELSAAVTAHLEGVQVRLKAAELARVEAQTRSEEESRRKRLYLAIAGLMLVLAAAGGVGAGIYRRAAATQRELTLAEQLAREEAQAEARRANAMRLAAESEKERLPFPVRSTLLAVEAVEVTRQHDGTILPAAFESLLNASIELHGPPLVWNSRRLVRAAGGALLSPDGRWLATEGNQTVGVWDLHSAESPPAYQELRGHTLQQFSTIQAKAFTPDSRWLVTGSGDDTARMWNLYADDPSESSLVFRGHQDDVSAVAVSPNSRWLATGSDDTTMRLWDLTAADPTSSWLELEGHTNWVTTVVFSRSGRWLATSCGKRGGKRLPKDNTIRLWDLQGDPGAPGPVLRGMPNRHGNGATSMAFGPRERWLLASGEVACLWDLQAEEPNSSRRLLQQDAEEVVHVAISRDGDWLATGGETVSLWRIDRDGELSPPQVLAWQSLGVTDMEFSPDSRWLATTSYDNIARLWDLASSDISNSTTGMRVHEDLLMELSFAPDNSFLVTGGWDQRVYRWDLTSNNPLSDRIVREANQDFTAVRFTSDTTRLIAASQEDNKLRVWNFQAGKVVGSPVMLDGHPNNTHWGLRISPNGRWLAMGSSNDVHVWDLVAENLVESRRTLAGHTDKVRCLTFAPDSRWLISTSQDGTVRVWDLDADQPVSSSIVLVNEGDDGYGAAVSPDGRWLSAIGNSEHTPAVIRLWNFDHVITAAEPRPPELQIVTPEDEGANDTAFTRDSQTLLVSTPTGKLAHLDVGAEDIVDSLRYTGERDRPNGTILVLPDGRRVITFGRVGKLQVWDVADQDNVQLGEFGQYQVRGTQIAVDSRMHRAVAGYEDSTAKVWDLTDLSARPLALRGHDKVACLCLSPDGRWVVTGGGDTLRIWDLDIEATIVRARRLASRELTAAEREQYALGEVQP